MCRRGGYGARLVILLMWHEEAHLDPLTVILQMIHLESIGLRSAMQNKAGKLTYEECINLVNSAANKKK